MSFDPDAFVLTKADVLKFIDLVLFRWKKNWRSNAIYIFGLELMRKSIQATPEKVVNRIWRNLLKFIDAMKLANAMALGKSQNEKWAFTLQSVEKKIEKGEFD